MSFRIDKKEISAQRTDAIVIIASAKATCGTGMDKEIYDKAGRKQLLFARKAVGDIVPGDVAETPAFALDAQYIIHAVAPAWNDGKNNEFETLRSCYMNSLSLAKKLNCKSIAFPLLASESDGFPRDKDREIAVSVIDEFLSDNDMKITLVIPNKKENKLSGALIDSIRDYVAKNFVKTPRQSGKSADSGSTNKRNELDCFEFGELRTPKPIIDRTKPKDSSRSNAAIEKLLASADNTFQEKLFEIIDSRGLTGPEVYKNYVSKQVYSKIQADRDYHPNKYTAIALCLSLHLDVDETQDLIGRAGWTLSNSSRADVVVKGCIIQKEYNKVMINNILGDFGCQELEKIK